ncbi:NAD-dependent epimerase/dehydratase family protein [Companilactobacillus jidongensis]|uniref:NAD-dependent epimerase/dehydratase family protein n=1 Tax=Companilactobacillus jidongensis TaxID=2486006 RepID=UPI000F76E681|nr:NAD-dependent epimerase/dehydratase family protein [Companilactobacillus jidongensis]
MTKTVLVTGGTGFLGIQLILQLLQQGYVVRTTMRSIKSKNKIINTLQDNGITKFDNLHFYEADLASDNNWETAMMNVDYVFSVASPVFFNKPDNEADAIRPAVEGIVRILRLANKAHVRRVVMTSNFGAVGFSKKVHDVATTENDWTDENQSGMSIYEKSKLLAEKAAWQYIERPDVDLEFATVNPVAIFGPSLNGHFSGSFDLLTNLLNGSEKFLVNIPLNIVDVRDVADIHIRAMITPEANGQRFIASADGQISMLEIAELLKEKCPDIAEGIPSHQMPNWFIKMTALFNNQAQEGKLFLDMNRNVSNQKAKSVLGWHPIADNSKIILDSVDSMTEHGAL